MNIKVILNPQAGGGRGLRTWKHTEKTLRSLQHTGIAWKICFSRGPEETVALAEAAAREQFDVIMAIGGDGTVTDVAQGSLEHKLPLVVMPAGTGNACARSLGMTASAKILEQTLTQGQIITMDAGRIGQSFFTNMAGIGFDSHVLHRYQKHPWAQGIAGYIGVGLKALFEYSSSPATITWGGRSETYTTAMIAVCNGAYYGGGLKMAPGADMSDGLLDVCILGDLLTTDYLSIWRALYHGTHGSHPKVKVFRCKEFSIDSNEKLRYHRDGDVVGETPCSVIILPRAVRFMIPERGETSEIQD